MYLSRIGVIVVSYKTNLLVEAFIRKFAEMDNSDFVDVFVVNNSAASKDDDSFVHLESSYPQVKFINAPDNPGYFGGAQRALEGMEVSLYQWIVVSNADIELKDHEYFKKLLRRPFEKNIGVMGPSIQSGLSGMESNPFMKKRPTESRMCFYRYCFSNFMTCWAYHSLAAIYSLTKKKFCDHSSRTLEPDTVYAVHGAHMIFGRPYFERGGNFYCGTYMYGEEIYVGETCLRLNLKSVVDPNLKVYHAERASTGIFYSKKIMKWKARSSLYLWTEFFIRNR